MPVHSDVSEPTLVVTIEPGEAEWGNREDDRWRRDLIELRAAVEREAGTAVAPAPVADNTMGIALIPIVIALGQAGVFTALVNGLKAFLSARPKHRSVTATVEIDGQIRTVTVTADNVDSNDLTKIAHDLLRADA
jgi:hypothetical protein